MDGVTYTIKNVSTNIEVVDDGEAIGTLRIDYEVSGAVQYSGWVERKFNSEKENMTRSPVGGKVIEEEMHIAIRLAIDRICTLISMRQLINEAQDEVDRSKDLTFDYQPRVRDKFLFDNDELPFGFDMSFPEI